MSSKQNIVADSWEDYDNDNISPPLPAPIILRKEKPTVSPPVSSNAWTNNPLISSETQIKIEGSTRSEYTPQIRILNRNSNPTKNQSSPSKTNYETANSLPGKSPSFQGLQKFHEKQRAYNEIRKRIMGDSESQTSTSLSSQQQKQQQASLQNQQLINQQPFLPMNNAALQKNIIRNPIGPDGTKGFNRRS